MLKPGGTLLYATCSVFTQENERVVERFLKEHSDAKECKIVAEWGIERPTGRQMFPHNRGHDGFYYARIKRIEEA
jgi:16S rRNA (cytosine967-C5)-methyltransferase